MRKNRGSILAAIVLVAAGSAVAIAGQVGNPLDVPGSVGAGHILLAPTPPSQSAADGGLPGTMATVNSPVPVAKGGTGATTAGAAAANNIGATAIANNLADVANAATARGNLGAAAAGANSDITGLLGLTTALPLGEGGTGATTALGALTNLGAAATLNPGYVSGNYYLPVFQQFGSNAISANRLLAVPFYAARAQTFTKIGFNVASASTTTHCELGVYANNSGAPGALLADAGSVTFSAASAPEITGVSIPLTQGWWWLALDCDGTPTLTTIASSPVTGQYLGFVNYVNAVFAYQNTSVGYGALPNPFPSPSLTGANGNAPLIGLRF